MNDHELDAPQDDLEFLVLSVAAGQADKETIADFLRAHTRPVEKDR